MFFVLFRMAKLARQGGMGALELEIGLTVIEGLAIQVNDIPFPSLVLCVAALTVLSLLRIEPAVVSRALLDILGNFAMVMT